MLQERVLASVCGLPSGFGPSPIGSGESVVKLASNSDLFPVRVGGKLKLATTTSSNSSNGVANTTLGSMFVGAGGASSVGGTGNAIMKSFKSRAMSISSFSAAASATAKQGSGGIESEKGDSTHPQAGKDLSLVPPCTNTFTTTDVDLIWSHHGSLSIADQVITGGTGSKGGGKGKSGTKTSSVPPLLHNGTPIVSMRHLSQILVDEWKQQYVNVPLKESSPPSPKPSPPTTTTIAGSPSSPPKNAPGSPVSGRKSLGASTTGLPPSSPTSRKSAAAGQSAVAGVIAKSKPVKKLHTLFDRNDPEVLAAMYQEDGEGESGVKYPGKFEPFLAGMSSCVVSRKKKTLLQLEDVVNDVMDSMEMMNKM